jgi:hypothetical protein
MGVAVVGIAFQDSLENGGDAFKIRFERAQSAKVAQRLTKNKNGDILRKKDDVYWVDCAVTGSNYGTSSEPKFPLKPFFEFNVFPAVKELVKIGGDYEGYQPVFQGDNAGPHTDKMYDFFVKEYCKANGWLWEPQGPQMPHVNVLDLAVFPSMSKRHSHLARAKHGNRVLKEDEIWDTALQVWENLPSCKIANSFVQAKRICEKIIKCGGGNDFLSGCNGGISSEIRKDFDETLKGNKRKDGLNLTFEEGLIGVIDNCNEELEEIAHHNHPADDGEIPIVSAPTVVEQVVPAETARSVMNAGDGDSDKNGDDDGRGSSGDATAALVSI